MTRRERAAYALALEALRGPSRHTAAQLEAAQSALRAGGLSWLAIEVEVASWHHTSPPLVRARLALYLRAALREGGTRMRRAWLRGMIASGGDLMAMVSMPGPFGVCDGGIGESVAELEAELAATYARPLWTYAPPHEASR